MSQQGVEPPEPLKEKGKTRSKGGGKTTKTRVKEREEERWIGTGSPATAASSWSHVPWNF